MKESHAIQALSALAHEHRMAIFKTLMREGPSGLPAGAIGERLELGGSKVSFHVGLMERAGLPDRGLLWRTPGDLRRAVRDGAGVRRRLTASVDAGLIEFCKACGAFVPTGHESLIDLGVPVWHPRLT
jgi:DNA-binding transcriptional ArsR family regulator